MRTLKRKSSNCQKPTNPCRNFRFLHCRKAVKAAIVLLPLLGITNIVNLIDPPADSVVQFGLWSYSTYFLVSFQGFFISLLYCYLNGEVCIIPLLLPQWRGMYYSSTATSMARYVLLLPQKRGMYYSFTATSTARYVLLLYCFLNGEVRITPLLLPQQRGTYYSSTATSTERYVLLLYCYLYGEVHITPLLLPQRRGTYYSSTATSTERYVLLLYCYLYGEVRINPLLLPLRRGTY